MTAWHTLPRFGRPSLRSLSLAFLLLVTACAGSRDADDETDALTALPRSSTHFFADAYEQVAEKYVRPVSLDDLASDGLSALHKLDASFDVVRNGESLDVRYHDLTLATYERPAPDDSYGWAQLTVAAINAGRRHSPALQSADTEALYQSVIHGMLSHLDIYSRYEGRAAAAEARAARDGFGGIGITLDDRNGVARVASVMSNTPAARSGVHQDDIIAGIDGLPTIGVPVGDLVKKLRGPIGADVRLTITRKAARAPIELAVTRTLIIPDSVVYRREGSVAYIHVLTFNQKTSDAVSKALRQADRDMGPDLQGVILDLRGNLGGLFDQAVSIADLFLSEGNIVSTRGRNPASAQSSFAGRGDIGEGLPLVLLVNGASASASEILAAALQDNGRAVVVGTTTYGKGTVQTVIPMPNDGELILTWARFFSPSGYPIADLGVLPSLCTEAGHPASLYLDAVRNGQLTGAQTAVEWRTADHTDMAKIKGLRTVCPPDSREHEADLDIARALLADRKLYARALYAGTLAAQAK